MLAKLPVEIILLICEYPKSKELKQLARTNKRMMQIIEKHLPKVLKRKILFYICHRSYQREKGIIYLFNPYTCSVEEIAKFSEDYEPYKIATTQDKIFAISRYGLFEIFDLNTRKISRGPVPPKCRDGASVAYFKDKLYYLGVHKDRVDVLIDGKWQEGPALPLSIWCAQTITCDGVLYVIDGWSNKKIYRLSDDEREWIEVGELPESRLDFGVASLNGKIYITGGENGSDKLGSCLCFDPSAPVDKRISRIAYMKHARDHHSLIVANGKLYAIGGFGEYSSEDRERQKYARYVPIRFCSVTEEYDPQTNEWRKSGYI